MPLCYFCKYLGHLHGDDDGLHKIGLPLPHCDYHCHYNLMQFRYHLIEVHVYIKVLHLF